VPALLPRLLALFLALAPVVLPALAGELEAARESTRVLEEELKLAARPQLYLVLDLSARTLVIKGRGVELRRMPVEEWRAADPARLDKVFVLRARPAIHRPKALPGQDPTLDPIELRHMPVHYDLPFDPDLVILVSPPPGERPWLWLHAVLRRWWNRTGVMLHLTLSQEVAQSLAWSLTDGMPLLIRRANE
jgi:hypothetical protein